MTAPTSIPPGSQTSRSQVVGDESARQQRDSFARNRATTARSDGIAAIIPPTLDRWFTPQTKAQRPDILDRVRKSMLADDPVIYAAMWGMIAGLDFASQVGEIRCPTLIMTGETDPICPPNVARALHTGISGSDLAIVPHAAHMCILEQPGFINERLAAFLLNVGKDTQS